MRRVLFPLIVVLLALTLHRFWPDQGVDSTAGGSADRAASPAAVHPAVPSDGPTSAQDTSAPAAAARRAQVAEPSTTERTAASAGEVAATDDVPRARVFGLVVDSNGRAAAGFALELHSGAKEWRPGSDVPRVSDGDWTYHGWRTETDAAGRFTFEVPVPTADSVRLHGGDHLHLGQVSRDFGKVRGRDEPRLVAGDNDLGTLVAPCAGALEGQVVDAEGRPLAGALVGVLSGPAPGDIRYAGFGNYSAVTETNTEGRYLLRHLPPGLTRLEAARNGFLTALAQEDVDARVGETLPGPTLRLSRAPTIAGIVIDEAGAPLGDVIVWGRPVSGRSGSGAPSGPDGRFVVHLTQDEPHSLRVHDPRFEPWGGETKSTTFEPGTTDVSITLKRVVRLTVVVVDAVTGAPVERFEVRTSLHADGLVEHPGGRVEISAEPGAGRALTVEASGYVSTEVEVVFDEGGVPLQTVRLEPGARVTARAVLDGRPVAGARVTLVAAPPPREASTGLDPRNWLGSTWHGDMRSKAARPRTESTDAAGRVVFAGLVPGTYWLTIDDDEAAPHVVSAFVVAARATVDLGDIELTKGATLRVTVRLAGGGSPVGLRYETGLRGRGDGPVERADGTFDLTGLAAGKHEVRLRADGWRLFEDAVRSFEVRAGETREVLFDLSEEPISEVTVRVTANGAPVAGADVALEHSGESSWSARLGTTDAEGVARGRVAAGRTVRAVASEGARHLGRSARFALTRGELPRVALEASVGTLVLQFQEDLSLPDDGGFELSLRQLDGTGEPEELKYLWLKGETPKTLPTFGVQWRTRRVELGRVATGRYGGHLHAWRRDEAQSTQVPIIPALAVEIEVRRGEVCTIDVPGR